MLSWWPGGAAKGTESPGAAVPGAPFPVRAQPIKPRAQQQSVTCQRGQSWGEIHSQVQFQQPVDPDPGDGGMDPMGTGPGRFLPALHSQGSEGNSELQNRGVLWGGRDFVPAMEPTSGSNLAWIPPRSEGSAGKPHGKGFLPFIYLNLPSNFAFLGADFNARLNYHYK